MFNLKNNLPARKYRLVSSFLLPILFVGFDLASLGAQQRDLWSGTWDTSSGVMTIQREGNRIAGAYNFRNGQFVAELKTERRARGLWFELDGNGNIYIGEFIWELSPDGRAFKGFYGQGLDGPMNKAWEGVKRLNAQIPKPPSLQTKQGVIDQPLDGARRRSAENYRDKLIAHIKGLDQDIRNRERPALTQLQAQMNAIALPALRMRLAELRQESVIVEDSLKNWETKGRNLRWPLDDLLEKQRDPNICKKARLDFEKCKELAEGMTSEVIRAGQMQTCYGLIQNCP